VMSASRRPRPPEVAVARPAFHKTYRHGTGKLPPIRLRGVYLLVG
jgi:hypothetical protein